MLSRHQMRCCHPTFGQRRLGFALAAVTLLCVLLAATTASRADATYYCEIWVPGNTDCANVAGGSWVNGYFDQNEVWDPNGWYVCQHTYIAGTGTTVSRRCGSTPQTAGYELMCYYAEGRELSAHAGNDNSFQQPIYGDAFIETVHCV
jgi:hypothetical protein